MLHFHRHGDMQKIKFLFKNLRGVIDKQMATLLMKDFFKVTVKHEQTHRWEGT